MMSELKSESQFILEGMKYLGGCNLKGGKLVLWGLRFGFRVYFATVHGFCKGLGCGAPI